MMALFAIIYFIALLAVLAVIGLALKRLIERPDRDGPQINLQPGRDYFHKPGGKNEPFLNWPVAFPLIVGIVLVYFVWKPIWEWILGY